MSLARKLDQFYTKPELAKALCADVPLEKYSVVIEPAYGTGSFLRALAPRCPNLVYFDIASADPTHRRDFLTFTPNVTASHNILTISNPPFGKNSSLAVKFFNHAAKFSHLIAFIVPKTFQKKSLQNRLDRNFHLKLQKDIPPNSFTFQGKDHDVPCVWQIWQKTAFERPLWNIVRSVSDFEFVNADENPNIAMRRVGGNAGRIYTQEIVTRAPQSHLFLRFKAEGVLERLQALNLENCPVKFMTAGCPSISKSEICDMYQVGI